MIHSRRQRHPLWNIQYIYYHHAVSLTLRLRCSVGTVDSFEVALYLFLRHIRMGQQGDDGMITIGKVGKYT